MMSGRKLSRNAGGAGGPLPRRHRIDSWKESWDIYRGKYSWYMHTTLFLFILFTVMYCSGSTKHNNQIVDA